MRGYRKGNRLAAERGIDRYARIDTHRSHWGRQSDQPRQWFNPLPRSTPASKSSKYAAWTSSNSLKTSKPGSKPSSKSTKPKPLAKPKPLNLQVSPNSIESSLRYTLHAQELNFFELLKLLAYQAFEFFILVNICGLNQTRNRKRVRQTESSWNARWKRFFCIPFG